MSIMSSACAYLDNTLPSSYLRNLQSRTFHLSLNICISIRKDASSVILFPNVSLFVGVDENLLDGVLRPAKNLDLKQRYCAWIVQKLISIITQSCQAGKPDFFYRT